MFGQNSDYGLDIYGNDKSVSQSVVVNGAGAVTFVKRLYLTIGIVGATVATMTKCMYVVASVTGASVVVRVLTDIARYLKRRLVVPVSFVAVYKGVATSPGIFQRRFVAKVSFVQALAVLPESNWNALSFGASDFGNG